MVRFLIFIASLTLIVAAAQFGSIDLPHWKESYTTKAHAQGCVIGGGLSGCGVEKTSGGGSPTFTSFANGQQTSCGFATTCTTAAAVTVPSGFVVVGSIANNQSASTGTISAIAVNSPCSGSLSSIAAAAAPTGTIAASLFAGTLTGGSCTITTTFSVASSLQNMAIEVGLLSNLNSTTPGTACTGQATNAANPYTCSTSITVSSGGFGIAVFGYNNTTAITSSNMTISDTTTGGTGGAAMAIGIGYLTAGGTATPSFAGANFVNAAIAGAPWR